MSAFDRIVGYEAIKEEFHQLIDMMDNPTPYDNLGAKLPHGILLSGAPGLGKSSICEAFIQESGFFSITLRKNSSNGSFVNEISKAFEDAKDISHTVIFLDDIDKFANEDENHCDAEEYIAVQSSFDTVKDADCVIVLATANNPRKLPSSLLRAGRFDRHIQVPHPSDTDAEKILSYYMADKKIDPNINKTDVVKMVGGNVAAVLESVMNDAAIMAGAERCSCIHMKHITHAVLRREYNCIDDTNLISEEELHQRAAHEAGHIALALALKEEIGLASVIDTENNDAGGFIHLSKKISRRPHDVLIALGGKAAVELSFPHIASGCGSDLNRACHLLKRGIANNATHGFHLLDSDIFGDDTNSDRDAVVKAELQRYYHLARNTLIENKALLDDICDALIKKHTLLYSDIREITEKHELRYAVV